MPNPRLQQLLELLSRYSWMEREEEFVLASGRRSRFYIDARLTTTRPEGARLAGECIYEVLEKSEAEAVGGMATAAIPLVVAAAYASTGGSRPLPGFYVRDQAKEHGAQRIIEGAFPDRPGAAVAMVEDTMTTGGSLLRAIEQVEAAGARVTEVVVLVDRREGGTERLREAGYRVTPLIEVGDDGRLRIAT